MLQKKSTNKPARSCQQRGRRQGRSLKIITSTITRLPWKYEPVNPLANQPTIFAIPASQISSKTVSDPASPSSSQPAMPPALPAYLAHPPAWPSRMPSDRPKYDAEEMGCTKTSGWKRQRQRLQPLSMLQMQYVGPSVPQNRCNWYFVNGGVQQITFETT